jgi:PAN domain
LYLSILIMDNDLIKISLNQGKQFKNYQGKIINSVETSIHGTKSKISNTKREGFEMPSNFQNTDIFQKRDERSRIISKSNQADQDQLNDIKGQYDGLLTQYNDTENSVNSNSLVAINRTSSTNPYLNKNITVNQSTSQLPITDLGYGGYVSGLGYFKSYPDQATFDSVAGKNGCPKNVIKDVSSNDYSSSLLQGQPMVANQSCGNEGKNVYVSKLIDNPSSSYVGCYNDKPMSTSVNAVPIMNSSNSVNGFVSTGSSVYQGNNNTYGTWAAFDQNPNTFWHSAYDDSTKYNSATGVYEGAHSIPINTVSSGILTIKGEFLQINMPGVNTSSVQNIKVTQYSIAPRLDLITTRSPNTWYLIGWKDSQWYEVDRQVSQNFTNSTPKTYNVANPGDYGSYIIIVEKVGNDDQTTLRECVQIAELNLFVNSDSSFTNDQRAMIYNSSSIGYTTFDNCKRYAIENDYKYFGLQDVQENGTAACLVSNDYDRSISYGDATTQSSAIPLWSSNTATGQSNTMQIVGSGQITIYDINSTAIFNSNELVAECDNWGTLIIDSATYGGNCKVPIGNDTSKVTPDCNYKDSCSIPISYSTFGDPAQGCAKTFDVAYKCGGKSFSKNLTSEAQGQTLILDCKDHMQTTCQFFMILQDDGNMCLYKGTDPSTQQDVIWSTKSNGLQKGTNPEWTASKGKYGRNYMKLGETLAVNEWVGSNDGSIKLLMQTDGNLVLYTSESKTGCSVKNDKTYGGGWVNAIYKIDQTGNKNTIGKVAYIDAETKLREYPSSLLERSNQYQLLNDFDSAGNDIQQVTTTTAEKGCIDACNANADCSGFVYQPNGSMCYIKNSSMYPVGEKQYYSGSGLIMGMRKPQISSSVNGSCSKDIVDIDSIQYDNYIKGDLMTTDTQCQTNIVPQTDKTKMTDIQNQMLSVGEQITNNSNNLYTENKDIYSDISANSKQFKKNVSMYRKNDTKIKNELNLPVTLKAEGMRSMKTTETGITMNDVNSMLSDTDIRVLQENYSYIFWSILAVGLLTITVSKIK